VLDGPVHPDHDTLVHGRTDHHADADFALIALLILFRAHTHLLLRTLSGLGSAQNGGFSFGQMPDRQVILAKQGVDLSDFPTDRSQTERIVKRLDRALHLEIEHLFFKVIALLSKFSARQFP
jgi:hypothetical protein